MSVLNYEGLIYFHDKLKESFASRKFQGDLTSLASAFYDLRLSVSDSPKKVTLEGRHFIISNNNSWPYLGFRRTDLHASIPAISILQNGAPTSNQNSLVFRENWKKIQKDDSGNIIYNDQGKALYTLYNSNSKYYDDYKLPSAPAYEYTTEEELEANENRTYNTYNILTDKNTITITQGGTGNTTITPNGIAYGSSSSQYGFTRGKKGQLLISGDSSNPPSWLSIGGGLKVNDSTLSLDVDTTLSSSGKAADAQEVGIKITSISQALEKINKIINVSLEGEQNPNVIDRLSEVFDFLKSNKSNIELITGKQQKITGAATTITDNDLDAGKVLISNSNGKVAVSSITTTTLSYLNEVTSDIQTQLNSKVTAVSGKGLSTNDYTTKEKNKLDGISAGAQVNQNAFSTISVVSNSTTSNINANQESDTLTISAGSNITLTPDTASDKITIAATIPVAGSNAIGGVKVSSTISSATGYTAVSKIADGTLYYKDTTYNVVSSTANGLAPKVNSTSSGQINNSADWILTRKNSGTIGWYQLPTAAFSDTVYTLPIASSTAIGGIKVSSTILNNTSGYKQPQITSDGTLYYKDTTYSDATTTTAGLMSTTDKTKLNGIATGAQVNQNAFSSFKVKTSTSSSSYTVYNAASTGDSFSITLGSNLSGSFSSGNLTINANDTDTTYNEVSTSAAGLVPKIPSSTSNQITQSSQWVLTKTSSGAGWYKLPDGAFSTGAVTSVNGNTGAVQITTITGNAGTATTLKNTRYIDGVSFTGGANVTRYATCGTAAGTAAKTASITAGTLSLSKGARVTIKFTYANTASRPTLNVGSAGAKYIYWHGTYLDSSQYWEAGAVLDFVYNETQWELIGVAKDNNTTVTVSDSISSNGTNPVTSAAIYTALAGKQNSVTGAASTIVSNNLTTNRALVSNANGKVAVSSITSTELGYLSGVDSSIQTQLNSKAPADRTALRQQIGIVVSSSQPTEGLAEGLIWLKIPSSS